MHFVQTKIFSNVYYFTLHRKTKRLNDFWASPTSLEVARGLRAYCHRHMETPLMYSTAEYDHCTQLLWLWYEPRLITAMAMINGSGPDKQRRRISLPVPALSCHLTSNILMTYYVHTTNHRRSRTSFGSVFLRKTNNFWLCRGNCWSR